MFKPAFLRNPANRKSIAPVVPDQFSVPGCARAIATSSASDLTGRSAGTAMTMMVLEIRAIGWRSLGLYGRLACCKGWAVNDELGEASRTWSSLAPTNV